MQGRCIRTLGNCLLLVRLFVEVLGKVFADPIGSGMSERRFCPRVNLVLRLNATK